MTDYTIKTILVDDTPTPQALSNREHSARWNKLKISGVTALAGLILMASGPHVNIINGLTDSASDSTAVENTIDSNGL